jgi:DNA-binding SARP family transcriptional activator
LSLVLLRTGDIARAEAELNAVLTYAQENRALLLLVETHLALALLKWAAKDKRATILHLTEGFEIIAAQGYSHFVILSRRDIIESCLLALQLKVSYAQSFATRFLTSTDSHETRQILQDLSEEAPPRMENAVLGIEQSLYRRQLPPLSMRTLGKFVVLRNDTPLTARDWKGTLPQLLLKLIITRGGDQVSQHHLTLELWPDEPPLAVDRNFRVALHKLRKALEPGLTKDYGSSYLFQTNNCLSLNQELCHVDLLGFESLQRQGRQYEAKGELELACTSYEGAIEMYRGEYLAEDNGLVWIQSKREEVRHAFVEVQCRLASCCEQLGNTQKAIDLYYRVLHGPVCPEKACFSLMKLLVQAGRQSQLVDVYETYANTLQQEMGIHPDRYVSEFYHRHKR